MITEYISNSVLETQELAIEIANQLTIGNVILLRGNLGSGKTTFTSYLIRNLLKENINVISPTFNLVKEYETNDYIIYHYDLYRLKEAKEIYELDVENNINNGISIFEWPEKIQNMLFPITFDIEIEIIDENTRIFKIKNDFFKKIN
jgi:tRNA threonylcarbamoyladenosine biosynthesis protein TsaE